MDESSPWPSGDDNSTAETFTAGLGLGGEQSSANLYDETRRRLEERRWITPENVTVEQADTLAAEAAARRARLVAERTVDLNNAEALAGEELEDPQLRVRILIAHEQLGAARRLTQGVMPCVSVPPSVIAIVVAATSSVRARATDVFLRLADCCETASNLVRHLQQISTCTPPHAYKGKTVRACCGELAERLRTADTTFVALLLQSTQMIAELSSFAGQIATLTPADARTETKMQNMISACNENVSTMTRSMESIQNERAYLSELAGAVSAIAISTDDSPASKAALLVDNAKAKVARLEQYTDAINSAMRNIDIVGTTLTTVYSSAAHDAQCATEGQPNSSTRDIVSGRAQTLGDA